MKCLMLLFSLCFGTVRAQTNEHISTTKYDIEHPEEAARLSRLVYVCFSHGAYHYHRSENCRNIKTANTQTQGLISKKQKGKNSQHAVFAILNNKTSFSCI